MPQSFVDRDRLFSDHMRALLLVGEVGSLVVLAPYFMGVASSIKCIE